MGRSRSVRAITGLDLDRIACRRAPREFVYVERCGPCVALEQVVARDRGGRRIAQVDHLKVEGIAGPTACPNCGGRALRPSELCPDCCDGGLDGLCLYPGQPIDHERNEAFILEHGLSEATKYDPDGRLKGGKA